MLTLNGRISLQAFSASASVLIVPILTNGFLRMHYLSVIYLLITISILYVRYKGQAFQVVIRSYILGIVFAFGVTLFMLAEQSWVVFGWYLSLLSLFHYSEYFTTSLINPKTLSLDSFLINHSPEYNIAAVCSWTEFLVERWIYPDMKISWISYVGLTLCIAGELLRKAAMFTARSNFNHIIQIQREEGHVLVTNGIYNLFRHPSYVGWFWWSVGTQVVLCNPFCLIGYTIASWKFFNARIHDEEITLLNFFGEDYVRYQKKVGTGLPFIKGYRLEL